MLITELNWNAISMSGLVYSTANNDGGEGDSSSYNEDGHSTWYYFTVESILNVLIVRFCETTLYWL